MFSNELVIKASSTDLGKYWLKKFPLTSKDWTIDRDRNCYLRVSFQHHQITFGIYFFFWKGHFIAIELNKNSNTTGLKTRSHWTLLKINDWRRGGEITDEAKEKLPEILADLKEALIAYKDFGAFSSKGHHAASFDFSKYEKRK